MVSDAELEKLDEEAARKEVEKLKGMGVISEISREESPEGAKWLTLKNIYDWRFRSPGKGEPERWLRRCGIVCRESKTNHYRFLCRDLCADLRTCSYQVDG